MTAVVLHEGYRRVEGGHDLALIRLETPVSLGSRAGIICLPKPRYPFAFGTPCWITGWGNVAENGENPRLGMGWVGGVGVPQGFIGVVGIPQIFIGVIGIPEMFIGAVGIP